MNKCPNCDGTGIGGINPVHGCDGTEEGCARTCPVPEPYACERCHGTGFETEIDSDYDDF